jgi:hypothetical protein
MLETEDPHVVVRHARVPEPNGIHTGGRKVLCDRSIRRRIDDHMRDSEPSLSIVAAPARVAQYRVAILHLANKGCKLLDGNGSATPMTMLSGAYQSL